MAAKFFTGLPLDGPDPECAAGYGAEALKAADPAAAPRPAPDHSHRGPVRGQAAAGRPPAPVPVTIGARPGGPPPPACDENPLGGLAVAANRPRPGVLRATRSTERTPQHNTTKGAGRARLS